MSIASRYPAIADLRARAQKRIPHFMWEYLASGTGAEQGLARSRAALDRLLFMPGILDAPEPMDLGVDLFGQRQNLPFGIAPIGMSGAIWPGAEALLADAARAAGIPYGLSTMTTRSPEDLAPHIGERGWFQLYAPKDPVILRHLLGRIKDAGFRVLVLTVDTPVTSRRERQVRGGLTIPPAITPRTLAHAMLRPAWSLGILRHGLPRMRTIEPYVTTKGPVPLSAPSSAVLSTGNTWESVAELRQLWDGPLVMKGVMKPADALRLREIGADAVWVSSHGARQLDAAPAPIDCLAAVRAALGPEYPVLYDGGIDGGLDILRALALGADFCFLGRAFHYAVAALGAAGLAHLIDILKADIEANLGQMQVGSLSELRAALIRPKEGDFSR